MLLAILLASIIFYNCRFMDKKLVGTRRIPWYLSDFGA